jgi:glycosyltransferase involved in cell wall biosynthesis
MRIGLVYPRANLDTVPSLIGTAELLAERGHSVEVFTHQQAGQPPPAFTSPRIRLRWLGVEGLADHTTAGLRNLIKRAGWLQLPGVARAPLERTYQALGAGLAGGSRLAARARSVVMDREEAFACVIGVDPDGLTLAHTLARGAPLVYYSLELLLSYELITPSDRQLKSVELELSRLAAFVIVQDEARGQLLAEDNGLALDRLVLVPNAPPGPSRRQSSRYWHDRFDLPTDARVVIHSGSLGDWTGVEAIVDSANEWPLPWVLVIHTRHDAESSSYVDQLRSRSDARRILFSLKPVARQAYDPLIDGADAGVAFYVPHAGSAFTQRNVQTIGLSSGKLAYYARAGLPVVVNRASSVADLVQACSMGVAVEDARAIGGALERLSADYDRFSAGALRFFDEHLDFRRAFAEAITRIEMLS